MSTRFDDDLKETKEVFDLRIYLKHYFQMEKWDWVETEWFEKWGCPFVAYQQGEMSKGKLCQIIARAVIRYYEEKIK